MRLTSLLLPLFVASRLTFAANSVQWVNVTGFWFSPAGGNSTHVNAMSENDCLTKAHSPFANYNNVTKSCYAIDSSRSFITDVSSTTAHAKYDPRVFVCYGNRELNGTVIERHQEALGFTECMAKSAAPYDDQGKRNKFNVITWHGEAKNGTSVGTCELKAMTSVSNVDRRGVISCKRLF
ncbi:hypothetical protein LEN26_006090 [Aphanomyces euteiches]|nr:hypothetical protein AeMF1_001215 [Aphanomyces euteiches]KAH9136595.1 hypothetical protein LEN26_006090 [Aphanomyces euteiches]KAH9194520.1 hypothetical protein AeNC1_003487 [Aphanomyces euteiches]